MTSNLDIKSVWEKFEPSKDQPWTNRMAAHLLRRAEFGGSISEIVRAKEMGVDKTLDSIFNVESAASYDQEMKMSGRLVSGSQDAKGLAAWWLLRMVQTPCALQEKMTLFWHGHFATGAEKVRDARAMLRQNEYLRSQALLHFEPMVTEMSRDVAMLIYLDSKENRKTRPNENYARELMELFCLGPGNYSEKDIKEIARCFTGWEVRKNRFTFNKYQHDTGEKTFLGITGKFDGNDAIKKILEQPAAANFVAKKLIRFFVFDDQPISDELAKPLAVHLRETDFNIGSAVQKLFGSKLFFSPESIGRKIKSPVELAIGVLRLFGASVNMTQLSNRLQRLGQLPLYPPNVKGWEGGRTWVNAATVLSRANLIQDILTNGETGFENENLGNWAKANSKHVSTDSLDWVNEFLFALPLSEEIPSQIVKEYQKNPAMAISWLAALPEFQLN